MMRKLFICVAFLLLALTSCYRGDLDDIQSRIDGLKTGRIATLETQIEKIDASVSKLEVSHAALAIYIKGLKEDLATLENAVGTSDDRVALLSGRIEELTSMAGGMSLMISDLKAYTDTYLAEYTDWADATLMTIDKYDSLCVLVARLAVKSKPIADLVSKVTESYSVDFSAALEKVSSSAKEWVNENIVYFCEIAEAEARLDSLRSALAVSDSEVRIAIDEQKEALAAVKITLTAGYKEAVKTAINELEGKLDDKLAAKLSDLNSTVGARVEAAEKVIDGLENAEKYMDSILKGIQSISVIPSYSDGSVMVTPNSAVFLFDVQPHWAIKSLVDSLGIDIFKVFVRDMVAKSGESSSTLPIDTVSVDKNGILQVKVNTSGLNEDISPDNADFRLSACLKICSGRLEVGSEYFVLSPVLDFFYFMSVDGKSVISLKKTGDPAEIDLYYSRDRAVWTSFEPGVTKVTLDSTLDCVWFRSGNENVENPPFSNGLSDYYSFNVEGADVEAGGRLDLLLQSTLNATKMADNGNNDYKFTRLFEDCTNLVSVRNLSAHLKPLSGICSEMFCNCIKLKDVPSFEFYGETMDDPSQPDPQYALGNATFERMFSGCRSLTSAAGFIKNFHDLTTVGDASFHEMFIGCVSLVTPPELPFTKLESYCYRRMFYGCSSLSKSPVLPARYWYREGEGYNTAFKECYGEMFLGCHNLSEIECHFIETENEEMEDCGCLKDWVKGVSPSGRFILGLGNDPEQWPIGTGGVPEGWTCRNSRLSAVIEPNSKFGKTAWGEEDYIAVNGMEYLAETTEEDPARANLNSDYSGDNVEKSPYVAFYPSYIYKDGFNPYMGVLDFAQDNSIDYRDRLPMFAVSETEDLVFKNICGVIAVKVGPEDMGAVNQIFITSKNKAMSGDFTVSDGKASLLYPNDVHSYINLDCCTSGAGTPVGAEGTVFYVVVPIQTYEGLTIEILCGDGLTREMQVVEAVEVSGTDICQIDFSCAE